MSDGATHININKAVKDLEILLEKYKDLQCKQDK